jgi:hypothetical protein
MVVQPFKNEITGKIHAQAFLAPSFEIERAKLLGMPFEEQLDLVSWEEHWNRYETLKKSWNVSSLTDSNSQVMVDEETRDFIQRGLSEYGFDVVGLGGEVERCVILFMFSRWLI